jgi:tetratricopeptide (TPR) repeat protein
MNSGSNTGTIEHLETIRENTFSLFGFQDEFDKKSNEWHSINVSADTFITDQWNHAKKAIKISKNPRTLAALGDIHFIKKNFSKAKDYYIKAIQLDKNLVSLYQKIIFIYISEGNKEKANEYNLKLLDLTNWRNDFLHSYVLFKTTFFDDEQTNKELLDLCLKAIEKAPGDFALLNTCGFINIKLKQVETAKYYFEKALALNGKYTHSLNNMGTFFLNKRNFSEALSYYKLAIESDANYLIAYENLAQCYTAQRKFKEAIETLDSANKNGLNLSEIWEHQRAWLYIQNHQYEKAMDWYRNQIKNEPYNNLLYNNLGYCLFRTGNDDAGEKYLNKSINILKRNARKKLPLDHRSLLAYYNLGRIAVKCNDSEKIKKSISEIRKIDYDNAFADYLCGFEKIKDEDYKGAKEYFLSALSKKMHIPELYLDLAFIHEAVDENYMEAIKLLEFAIKNGNEDFLFYNNLAYAYIEIGELERAEKIINFYDEKTSPLILTNKGMIAFRRDDAKRGDKYFNKAISILDGNLAITAKQYQLVEKINYFIRKEQNNEAKKYLQELSQLKGTYLDKRIGKLRKKLQ